MKKLAIAFIAVPLLFLQACKEEKQAIVPQIKAVKTIVMKATGEVNTRKLSGVVKTAKESNLSFRVSGRVATVDVKNGDSVKKGQKLATLEQEDFLLAVSAAKAKLQSAEAELVTAKKENARQQNLLKQKFVSKAAAEKSTASYQDALSKVAVIKTDLQTTEDNLTRTILRAPFDGKIADKEVEAFSDIQSGSIAFLIQGDEGLEVDILVPETLINTVKKGEKSSVSFPAFKGINLNAMITQIGARSEAGNAFPVTLKLTESNDNIRAGMTAEVAITVQSRTKGATFLIPTSAVDLRFVTADEGVRDVLVFDPKTSTLKKVSVAVSDIRGNDLEVVGGLKAGDHVVVAGVPFLSEGQKVKLWEPQYSIPAILNK